MKLQAYPNISSTDIQQPFHGSMPRLPVSRVNWSIQLRTCHIFLAFWIHQVVPGQLQQHLSMFFSPLSLQPPGWGSIHSVFVDKSYFRQSQDMVKQPAPSFFHHSSNTKLKLSLVWEVCISYFIVISYTPDVPHRGVIEYI